MRKLWGIPGGAELNVAWLQGDLQTYGNCNAAPLLPFAGRPGAWPLWAGGASSVRLNLIGYGNYAGRASYLPPGGCQRGDAPYDRFKSSRPLQAPKCILWALPCACKEWAVLGRRPLGYWLPHLFAYLHPGAGLGLLAGVGCKGLGAWRLGCAQAAAGIKRPTRPMANYDRLPGMQLNAVCMGLP